MKKETILNSVEEHSLEFVQLFFTDVEGVFKHLELPITQIEKILNNETMFDGSSINGFTKIEASDMVLFPDLNTWKVDTNEKVGLFICDVYYPNGTPFEGDPRNVLKRAIEKATDKGFTSFNVGPEPEFFLFTKEGNQLVPNDNGGYFDVAPLDKTVKIRREITKALQALGLEVEALHHEVAIGQHEIDWKYAPGLQTADNIQLFKYTVKTIAEKNGLVATFMPKPIFGENGSGMHCHMSLGNDNGNAFYDQHDSIGLSETARQFIAGVLTHARANASVTNPTVNSYKRLVPGYEAPVYVAWSQSNRTCTIRIPAARGAGTRIEVRNPDPSANPYLALAVLLSAGLDGIERKLTPPVERSENLYLMDDVTRKAEGIETLPGSLLEAVTELENSEFLQQVLGKHVFYSFLQNKKEEWDAYRLRVSEWEKETYLNC
ncbi:glutamine synthetase family protein [Bacillus sp. UNCCL81]|uniref:glutamine synthetase family protein n=1 Tax=Bacillus sp. UNCCL81 TaxID=1502755 RepID=UPI0008F3B94E|nr:glutamine synthetase family protein [Bacillus sp. UNCCL81]SFC55827.1 L-glutamine synthetase [Bacillus sp. UNCCL81]